MVMVLVSTSTKLLEGLRSLQRKELSKGKRDRRRSAYLALGDLRLDGGPGLALGGIGEEVHDDGTLGDGLVDLEKVLAGDPAILLGILPGLAVLADTDDDVEAVVTEVEALAVTLRAVSDKGESIVLEVLLRGGRKGGISYGSARWGLAQPPIVGHPKAPVPIRYHRARARLRSIELE